MGSNRGIIEKVIPVANVAPPYVPAVQAAGGGNTKRVIGDWSLHKIHIEFSDLP